MQNSYDIYLGQVVAGKVNIRQEGLYYYFQCHCKLPTKGMHCAVLRSGDKEFNLGICIPDGNSFSAHKRIAKKELDHTQLFFYLREKTPQYNLPIEANKPFLHLQELERAYLDISSGKPYIYFSDSSASSSPTGQ